MLKKNTDIAKMFVKHHLIFTSVCNKSKNAIYWF